MRYKPTILSKKLATLLLAGTFILGAYVWSFGMTASLSALVSGPSTTTSQQSSPAAAAGRPPRPGGGATSVVVEPMKRQPYIDILRAIGSAVAQRSVDVVASVTGTVTETSIQSNTEVAVGVILVKLDDRTESLNLEIAQAELDQALQTVARYKSLSNNADVTAVDVADAAVAARLAEANFGLARIALDDRTIRAPIAGRLGLSDVEVGDRITSDQVIVTIDDAETLLIQFELPERSIGLLEIGRSFLANTPVFTGRTFEGEVIAFDSRLDDVTRSVTVRARLENPDRLLWSGMTFAIRMVDQTVEFANQLREAGQDIDSAIRDALRLRIRPVLMTMVSTVCGGLPLILTSGAGAEARIAVGWVIVGGLGFATAFTLFLTPVFYRWIAIWGNEPAAKRLSRERRGTPTMLPTSHPASTSSTVDVLSQ